MILQYIENPNIKKHRIKEIIQTIIEEGPPGKWVIVDYYKWKNRKRIQKCSQQISSIQK
jgi:hypothetical protein